MATNIRRRGKSWCVVYRRDGRQHWRSFKTKEEAELFRAQMNLRRAQGQPEPEAPKGLTLREFAEREWLPYKRGRVGEQTLVNYSNVLRVHILPTLGHLELRKVTRKTLDDFVSDWLNAGPLFTARVELAREREADRAREQQRDRRPVRIGRSPKTISNAIVVLGATFKRAVDVGYLAANPAARLERPHNDSPSDEAMTVLDAIGLRALVDAADGQFARTLIATAALTGMRRGELLAVRWRDVDYSNGRVWVRRSVGLGGAIKTPKTKKSIRPIALPPMLASELEALSKKSIFRAQDDLVFASERGTPLDGRNMVRVIFEPAKKRAGIKRLRFHDLRHSYASVLIDKGVHPKTISELLGHASVAITMDRYSHLFDRAYTDVSKELEAAWTASGLQASPLQIAAGGFHSNRNGSHEVPAKATD
jgi:integrase